MKEVLFTFLILGGIGLVLGIALAIRRCQKILA